VNKESRGGRGPEEDLIGIRYRRPRCPSRERDACQRAEPRACCTKRNDTTPVQSSGWPTSGRRIMYMRIEAASILKPGRTCEHREALSPSQWIPYGSLAHMEANRNLDYPARDTIYNLKVCCNGFLHGVSTCLHLVKSDSLSAWNLGTSWSNPQDSATHAYRACQTDARRCLSW